MANVFSSSSERASERAILKDERLLYPDFVPERLPFRDKEVSDLVFATKPATQGKKPENVFVFGKPGTGKTVTLKFVLGELEEYSDRAKCVYVNCFETGSRNSILAKLTNKLGYPVPFRGMSSEELFDRFIAVLRSKKVIPVIVFDEAEQLLKDDESKKLLYDLSRIPEQHKLFVGIVCISNDSFFLSHIDDRVRSSLQATTIAFEQYSPSELKEILKERAAYAFFDNSLEEEVIPLCAAHAAKNGGDARIAVDVLLKAARLAEKESAKKVSLKHVRAAFMQEKAIKPELAQNLSDKEAAVLAFISAAKGGEVDTGAVYEALSKQFAERTLRQAVSDLEKKKLIVTEKKIKGRGFTRVIKKAL